MSVRRASDVRLFVPSAYLGDVRQFTLVTDDATAERIEGLAVRFGLTEQEVLDQLVGAGLEELD